MPYKPCKLPRICPRTRGWLALGSCGSSETFLAPSSALDISYSSTKSYNTQYDSLVASIFQISYFTFHSFVATRKRQSSSLHNYRMPAVGGRITNRAADPQAFFGLRYSAPVLPANGYELAPTHIISIAAASTDTPSPSSPLSKHDCTRSNATPLLP